jgi:hemoglobin-like flavoprotein
MPKEVLILQQEAVLPDDVSEDADEAWVGAYSNWDRRLQDLETRYYDDVEEEASQNETVLQEGCFAG